MSLIKTKLGYLIVRLVRLSMHGRTLLLLSREFSMMRIVSSMILNLGTRILWDLITFLKTRTTKFNDISTPIFIYLIESISHQSVFPK